LKEIKMAVGYKQRGNVVNYYENSGSLTLNKSSRDWISLMITNDDGTNNLTITVNGLAMIVKPGETIDEDFEDFNSVIISANGNYRI